MKYLLITTFIFLSCQIFGRETRYLVRSPRALLMGDAFTAIANDEYSLFYNPAATEKDALVTLTPANVDVGLTNITEDWDRFSEIPSEVGPMAEQFMGYPIYLHAGYTPGIKFGPFAFSYLANSTNSIVIRNRTYPVLDIDYRFDRGFLLNYAHSGGPGEKKLGQSKGGDGYWYSIGTSVKQVTREAIYAQFDLLSGSTIDIARGAGDNDFDQILDSLGRSRGQANGLDIGMEYGYRMGPTELAFAFSILDVGGMHFDRQSGTGTIPDQEMIMNAGVSFSQKWTFFDYALSADLHPINRGVDYITMMHFGAEIAIPFLRFMAGWNGGYLSYGANFNLGSLLSITAGFYGVELGTEYKEQEGKRLIIYLSILDFSFDP